MRTRPAQEGDKDAAAPEERAREVDGAAAHASPGPARRSRLAAVGVSPPATLKRSDAPATPNGTTTARPPPARTPLAHSPASPPASAGPTRSPTPLARGGPALPLPAGRKQAW